MFNLLQRAYLFETLYVLRYYFLVVRWNHHWIKHHCSGEVPLFACAVHSHPVPFLSSSLAHRVDVIVCCSGGFYFLNEELFSLCALDCVDVTVCHVIHCCRCYSCDQVSRGPAQFVSGLTSVRLIENHNYDWKVKLMGEKVETKFLFDLQLSLVANFSTFSNLPICNNGILIIKWPFNFGFMFTGELWGGWATGDRLRGLLRIRGRSIFEVVIVISGNGGPCGWFTFSSGFLV